eukprot:scaffold22736_cov111-Cylindrotheca_fusiformis.AAC.11
MTKRTIDDDAPEVLKQSLPLPPYGLGKKNEVSSSLECGRISSIRGKRPRHCVVISPDATPLVALADDDLTSSSPPSKGGVALVFEAAPLHVNTRLHKERPSRIACIRNSLQTAGVLDCCQILEDDHRQKFSNGQHERMLKIIESVHSKGYIKRLQNVRNCSCLQDEADQYDSVYLTPYSWDSAVQSVSSLCQLIDQVLSPKVETKYGFACIRPPGHHASMSLANGYCLVNNVAVAAQYALDHFTQHQQQQGRPPRIAIIDWDVHHGDGTQAIFWNNPNVLYTSIHVQQTFPYVPGSTAKNVGGPNAKGKTVNIPWSSNGMGDGEYLAAMDAMLLPIVNEFQPTLILISAGFDAAVGDVGKCNVTPDGFGQMARQVLKTAKRMDCPVVASLEGGYRHSVLGECVTKVVQAMEEFASKEQEELPSPRPESSIPDPSLLEDICPIAAKNIRAAREVQSPYWSCFSK